MKITYDIGMGNLGGGMTIWNRNEIENNDYKILAVISNTGTLHLRVKDLPEEIMAIIENEQVRMYLQIAKNHFEENGKAYFLSKDKAQFAALFQFEEELKLKGVGFGETNVVPEQYIIYDTKIWNADLRRIKDELKRSPSTLKVK